MTDLQKDQIATLRGQDYGYVTIANAVGLKKDTVVAFCRKMGLTGTKAQGNDRITLDTGFCLHCGNLLQQPPGRKKVKFCSSICRTAWWNSHPEAVNRRPCIVSPAPIAESPLQPMEMPDGNTAPTPVTSQSVIKAVMYMSEVAFRAELQYQAAVSIAKNLLSQGLLTEEEYAVNDTKLMADFGPTLGTLLSENDLIN